MSKQRDDLLKLFPIGTRLELNNLCNEEKGMPKGLRGTVIGADDLPSLFMHWDNGRSLKLLPDDDDFRRLTPDELNDEKYSRDLVHVCDKNIWLRNYEEYPKYDYPYSFEKVKDLDELTEKFKHGNWGLRTGFVLGDDLAFVQQVNGGDEWLALKYKDGEWSSFESISCEAMIARDEDDFRQFMCDMVADEFGIGMSEDEGMQMT